MPCTLRIHGLIKYAPEPEICIVVKGGVLTGTMADNDSTMIKNILEHLLDALYRS